MSLQYSYCSRARSSAAARVSGFLETLIFMTSGPNPTSSAPNRSRQDRRAAT
jgi:hypothetical protein